MKMLRARSSPSPLSRVNASRTAHHLPMGENVKLHVVAHVVVENQIALGDPPHGGYLALRASRPRSVTTRLRRLARLAPKQESTGMA
jgi:hypothetical protein